MAIAIDATVGGGSANSFTTLAEANTFMTARLNASSWETDASDDDKNRALVEATRFLSALRWQGTTVDTTQALTWPRQWVTDPDNPTLDYFSTTAIPERVKDATMELAFQFIKQGTTDVAAQDGKDNVKRQKVDVLEVEYFEHGQTTGVARYPRVYNWLLPLLESSGALTAPLVRG